MKAKKGQVFKGLSSILALVLLFGNISFFQAESLASSNSWKAKHDGRQMSLELPDGSEWKGDLEIRQGIRNFLGLAQENLDLHDVADSSQIQMSGKETLANIALPGGYSVYMSTPNWHYIDDCMRRYVTHVDINLSKSGKSVAKLIIGVWKDPNGKLCLAIDRPVKSKCMTLCSPSYNDVRDGIKAFLVGAGVAVAVATVIAGIIALVALAALAL